MFAAIHSSEINESTKLFHYESEVRNCLGLFLFAESAIVSEVRDEIISAKKKSIAVSNESNRNDRDFPWFSSQFLFLVLLVRIYRTNAPQ